MRIKFRLDTKLKKDGLREIAKRVLWKSMNKAEELAKRFVAVDTGILKNSIHIYPVTSGFEEYTLSDAVEYGIHVEFGTSPHIIEPVSAKSLAFEWTEVAGKMVGTKGRRELKVPKSATTMAFFKKVRHPGTNTQPFMRPAVDEVNRYWVNVFWKEELAKS